MQQTLLYLIDPKAKAPTDPETEETLTRVKERIAFLVRELEENHEIRAKLRDHRFPRQ